jgi:hypothetical protein
MYIQISIIYGHCANLKPKNTDLLTNVGMQTTFVNIVMLIMLIYVLLPVEIAYSSFINLEDWRVISCVSHCVFLLCLPCWGTLVLLLPVDCVRRKCILRTVSVCHMYMRTKIAWVVQVSGSGMVCVVGFACKMWGECVRRAFGVLEGAGSYVSSFFFFPFWHCSIFDICSILTLFYFL